MPADRIKNNLCVKGWVSTETAIYLKETGGDAWHKLAVVEEPADSGTFVLKDVGLGPEPGF